MPGAGTATQALHCAARMMQTGMGRVTSVPMSLAEEERNSIFNCLFRYFELIGILKWRDKKRRD